MCQWRGIAALAITKPWFKLPSGGPDDFTDRMFEAISRSVLKRS